MSGTSQDVPILMGAPESPGLLDIPMELLLSTTRYLSTSDYGHLRLTCRAIERKLFDAFAQEFFSTRQVCIFPQSLQNIVDISQHPELRHSVKKLILGLDRVIEPWQGVVPAGSQIKREDFIRSTEMLRAGSWIDYLEEALPSLSSLQTLEIRDFVSNRARVRDGTPWRSYFIPTLLSSTPNHIIQPHSVEQGWVVPLLLKTLTKTNKTVGKFEDITRTSSRSPLNLNTFILPHMQSSYHNILQQFKTIMLRPLHFDHTHEQWSHLRTILQHGINLEHIRLNFAPGAVGPASNFEFFESLASKKLKRLDLGSLELQIPHPNGLVRMQDTLEHLSLHRARVARRDVLEQWLDKLSQLTALKTIVINDLQINDLVDIRNITTVLWKPYPSKELETERHDIPGHNSQVRIFPLKSSVYVKSHCAEQLIDDLRQQMVIIDADLLAEYDGRHNHIIFSQTNNGPEIDRRNAIERISPEPEARDDEDMSDGEFDSDINDEMDEDQDGEDEDDDDGDDDFGEGIIQFGYAVNRAIRDHRVGSMPDNNDV